MASYSEFMRNYYKQIISLLTPIILFPMTIIWTNDAVNCGYIMLVMIVYWCTQVVPLTVTALLPIVLLPLFGISETGEVASHYIKNTNIVILGGLIVAQAIETSGLHKRIAVHVIVFVGANLRWLMLGFQLTTALISMCIVNTAAVAMMLPILKAVTNELYSTDVEDGKDIIKMKNIELDITDGVVAYKRTKQQREARISEIALTLSVVNAANIGGLSTLTGTSPNLILKHFVDEWFISKGFSESPLNFTSWLLYGVPISILNIFILWFWFQLYYMGPRKTFGIDNSRNEEQENRIINTMREEKNKLGSIRFSEKVVISLFIILVLSWFLRSPGFMPGWEIFFKQGFVGTAIPPMIVVFLLFIIPMHYPGQMKGGNIITILNWSELQRNVPWGIVFLMGGGFAIGSASVKTGLAYVIGSKLIILGQLPEVVMIYLICFVIGLLTEFTSNVAACTMLMPIVATMATELGYSPLYLMLPVGVTTSLAFMFPVANPPNALGFEFANLSIKDMALSGSVLKILTIIPVTFMTQTFAYSYFDFATVPQASNNNSTLVFN